MLNSGVYIIVNRFNGKIYVGSTTRRFDRRWKEHQRLLKRGVHRCIPLQMAYNKYGEKYFEFKVISTVPANYCLKMEQYFINTLNPEYNVCKVAGNTRGNVLNESGRKIISEKLKGNKNSLGVKRSKEYLEKMKSREIRPLYDYVLVNESGKEYHTSNLKSFCNANGLHNCNIRQHYLSFLKKGINNFYKGFALIRKMEIENGQSV